MHTQTDHEHQLRGFLRDRFPGYEEDFGTDEDLSQIVDSLGLFELVEFVERSFDVKVGTMDFTPQRFSSIERVLQLIEELKGVA